MTGLQEIYTIRSGLMTDSARRNCLSAPARGGIHYHCVEADSLFCTFPEVLSGVAAVERRVPGDPVQLAVLHCVPDRRGVILDTLNRLNTVGSDDSDGARYRCMRRGACRFSSALPRLSRSCTVSPPAPDLPGRTTAAIYGISSRISRR